MPLRELQEAIEDLRRKAAAVHGGLSQLRRRSLLPSLDITRQQQEKRLLQREMEELLQAQRMEALLMAAENSCVSRQLPLQAALLMEGAALYGSPREYRAPPTDPTGPPQQAVSYVSIRRGIRKVLEPSTGRGALRFVRRP